MLSTVSRLPETRSIVAICDESQEQTLSFVKFAQKPEAGTHVSSLGVVNYL